MEVNEGKNWMKNKMKKRLKISLLLDAQCWLFRHASGMYLMAKFGKVSGEVAFEFCALVSSSLVSSGLVCEMGKNLAEFF